MWRMTIYCGFLILLQVERWRRPKTIEYFFVFFWHPMMGGNDDLVGDIMSASIVRKGPICLLCVFSFIIHPLQHQHPFVHWKKCNFSSSAQISDGVAVRKNWTEKCRQNFAQSSASKMYNAINAFIRSKALFWDTQSWVRRDNESEWRWSKCTREILMPLSSQTPKRMKFHQKHHSEWIGYFQISIILLVRVLLFESE